MAIKCQDGMQGKWSISAMNSSHSETTKPTPNSIPPFTGMLCNARAGLRYSTPPHWPSPDLSLNLTLGTNSEHCLTLRKRCTPVSFIQGPYIIFSIATQCQPQILFVSQSSIQFKSTSTPLNILGRVAEDVEWQQCSVKQCTEKTGGRRALCFRA